MADRPTGTVTFLMSDVEGSTRLWEDYPSEMRVALERHDELVRSTIDSRDGHVFSTAGDAFAAAFSRVGDAIGAAVDIQRRLGGEDWPDLTPIRVRIGLHIGEAHERDGNYFGPALNRVARLMASGHGGQILASAQTVGLASPSVDLEWFSLGEHRLKDLGEPIKVWSVRGPGLQSDFAPLRTLDAVPGNLPCQLSALFGRGLELARVALALQDSRLVSVIGTGGVGKTRLALQLAAEAADDFPDGVWICDLSAVSDSRGVWNSVLSVLDRDRGQSVSIADVTQAIGKRQLLVLLDNCEHVTGPVSELASAVLAECPQCWMLLTSREPIGARGEATCPISPLSLLEGPASPAVALFVDRAHMAGATDVAPETAGVVELVRALDGLPLAIELAAARTRAFTPSEMTGLLGERFQLLRDRRSDNQRHAALQATLDWSYDLLGDDEQSLFDRLAVFRGPVSLTSIREICAGDGLDDWDIADLVGSLVDRSLVVADQRDERTWYRLLESLRHYATTKLNDTEMTDRWQTRHAETYVALAEHVATELRANDETRERWFRFVNEYDNLAEATNWARTTGHQALTDRLEPAAARARFTVSIQSMGLTSRYLDHDLNDNAAQHANRIRLQHDAFASLIALCHELTQTEWDLPTDCERWSVKDIISHICAMLAAFTGAPLAPLELPAEFDPGSDDPMFNLHVTVTEMHIIARRKLPPAAVLADLIQLTDARLRHESEGLIFDMPGRAMDEAVGVLTFDIWTHEQDIRRATDRPGNLDSAAAQEAVDRGLAVLPFIVGKRADAPDGTVVRIDITDPIPQTTILAVARGRATISDLNTDPTVHITMNAETFCCLGAGRWTVEQAVANSANIHGDIDLGQTICESMGYVP